MKKIEWVAVFVVFVLALVVFILISTPVVPDQEYNPFVLVLYDDVQAYEANLGGEISESTTYWFWDGNSSDYILSDLAERGFPIDSQQLKWILGGSDLDDPQVEGISILFDNRQEVVDSVRILWNLSYNENGSILEGGWVDKTISLR